MRDFLHVHICGHLNPCIPVHLSDSSSLIIPWTQRCKYQWWGHLPLGGSTHSGKRPEQSLEVARKFWGPGKMRAGCVGCSWAYLLSPEISWPHAWSRVWSEGGQCMALQRSRPRTGVYCLGPRYYCSVIVRLYS